MQISNELKHANFDIELYKIFVTSKIANHSETQDFMLISNLHTALQTQNIVEKKIIPQIIANYMYTMVLKKQENTMITCHMINLYASKF